MVISASGTITQCCMATNFHQSRYHQQNKLSITEVIVLPNTVTIVPT